MEKNEKRYIGLDVHKHYLIALGVDENLEVVLTARRVELSNLESWMKKNLTKQDEVVLEMTTNTWQLYDELIEYAGSVTVVHPPHVGLITRSQVMTDKIAASILARLDADKREARLALLEPADAKEVRTLMSYESGTAGSVMDARITTFRTDATVKEALAKLRSQRGRPIADVFVIGEDGRLAGAEYWAGLSADSKRSLELQGGIFTDAEADAFITQPHAADAVRVRLWDDMAKSADAVTPSVDRYLALAERLSCR